MDYQTGRFQTAIESIQRALVLNPGAGVYHCNLGLALEAAGRIDEAVVSFQRAVRWNPNLMEAHANLGTIFLRRGKWDEARACFEQAIRLRPDYSVGHNKLGTALAELGQLEAAISCLRTAVRVNPEFVEAWTNLGNVLTLQEHLDEAIDCHREALRINPDHAEALSNLGEVLARQGKFVEAADCHQRAVRAQPQFATAYSNLGFVREQQGCFDEALGWQVQALRIDPGHAQAHFNRALLRLRQGNWREGWPEYEWRWRTKGYRPYSLPGPRWDGSPLAGRTLLLLSEQGLGDTLQFAHFVPLLKARGGKIIVQCQPALCRLLAGTIGIDGVVSQDSRLPDFDVEAPLGSLPAILRSTPETVSATVPYLRPDVKLMERWRQLLRIPTADIGLRTSDLLVGIAWQGNPRYGNDHQRSIPLKYFARLAQIKGVHLISLQKGPGTEQLQCLTDRFVFVFDIDEAGGAFVDTAAIMTNLDLVISSDTAIPHLAGALGVPVWLPLAKVPDWRWTLDGQDCPWYPTMRLFRQTRHGQWDDVFDRIAEELEKSYRNLLRAR
jgi:tetratricopeptide (TPR) repeat protein